MLLEIIWLVLIVCGVVVLGIRMFTGIKLWSWSGLLFAAFTIILALYIFLPLIDYPQVHSRYYSLQNNLKQWGLVFKMYANESPGELFPPLTQQDGLWVPDFHAIFPEYLTDPTIACDPDNLSTVKRMNDITSREHPDPESMSALMAHTYVYTGWVVRNDADVAIMKHYRAEKNVHIGDIELEDTHLYWMREDVEDRFITGARSPRAKALEQASIPVMIARPRPPKNVFSRWWKKMKQGHWEWKPESIIPVLFLDGHIEEISLSEAPDYIKALVKLFPELLEGEFKNIDERDKKYGTRNLHYRTSRRESRW